LIFVNDVDADQGVNHRATGLARHALLISIKKRSPFWRTIALATFLLSVLFGNRS